MSFENSMIIASALQVPFSFDLWALSWEKMLVENGEAICSVCETIAFYVYDISSGPFFLWSLTWEKLLVENGEAISSFGEAIAFYDYNVSSGPFFLWFLTWEKLLVEMVRLFAILVRLLHSMIIASALVPFESFFWELEVRKVMGGKWWGYLLFWWGYCILWL